MAEGGLEGGHTCHLQPPATTHPFYTPHLHFTTTHIPTVPTPYRKALYSAEEPATEEDDRRMCGRQCVNDVVPIEMA